jgi:peptidyl-prolyl cis-trans isomerase C
MRSLSAAVTILSLLVLAGPAASQEVLASVDDATLTWEDLLEMVGGQENADVLQVANDLEAMELLQSWVREELIVRAAESRNLQSDPMVQEALDQARRQILIEAYLQRMMEDVQVSQMEVENYVSTWEDSYNRELKLRHILVDDQTLASALLTRLRAGQDFEQLASQYSMCPSGEDGGNLGWIRRGDAAIAFEEAAFTLEQGELSGVVETPMGFHVIQMLDSRPRSDSLGAQEVAQLVGMQLTQEAQQAEILEQIGQLEQQYSVNIYPERLLEHF